MQFQHRCQQVYAALAEGYQGSIRQLARQLGLAKSSVHRIVQRLERRHHTPDSGLWESPAGAAWLVRLSLAVIYLFGLQAGVGTPTLSKFFQLLHLEQVVASSPKTLERLMAKVAAHLSDYPQADWSALAQQQTPLELCLAADEMVVDEAWLLVLQEVSSGYLVMETLTNDRSYETWKQQVEAVLQQAQVRVRYLVSDRAKPIIALAKHHLRCADVADLFHGLYGLSRGLGQEIRQHVTQVERALRRLSEHSNLRAQRQQLLEQWLERAQYYQQQIETMTTQLHPFSLDGHSQQTSRQVSQILQACLANLRQLRQQSKLKDRHNSLATFEAQIPSLTQLLDLWWEWTQQSLGHSGWSDALQQWALTVQLPLSYWTVQHQRTKTPKLKAIYQAALQQAQQHLQTHPLTHQFSWDQRLQAQQWAHHQVLHFQRTSSAVEGRNGYLAQIHHRNRGLSPTRLKALTVIHNFALQRPDGSTAAERLWGQSFPDLFEWLVQQIPELPQPRRSRNSRTNPQAQSPQAVPP